MNCWKSLLRAGTFLCAVGVIAAGCAEKPAVKADERLFGNIQKNERDQILEMMNKAGIQGDIAGIESKPDHWLVDFNIAQVGKDGKRKRAMPVPPTTFKVTKDGKVAKL